MGQLLTKKKEEFAPAKVRPTVSTSSQYFANYAELFKTHGIIPDIFLVHEAPSCQYIDEDGDVANEFLTEETDGKKSSLRKVVKNITPKSNMLNCREEFDVENYSPIILHN
ncbi:hypothetical protein WR25_22103 [Diploscapter pachys]|uniref:Uncharacterized protein n=1 Tax=Diploscapter pachys TaxID=2018661 RepID=A0A2A2JG69_9BILA|nr:hypothetical protein WR25_22103 [Diploscapter pachys]